jgi:hypothetical protein
MASFRPALRPLPLLQLTPNPKTRVLLLLTCRLRVSAPSSQTLSGAIDNAATYTLNTAVKQFDTVDFIVSWTTNNYYSSVNLHAVFDFTTILSGTE